jgi:thermitase
MKILRIILPGLIVIAFLTFMVRVAADDALAAVSALPMPRMPVEVVADTSVVEVAEAGPEAEEAMVAPEVVPFVPNDTYFDMLWALPHIQIEQLWQTTSQGAGVMVAVLDTGIDGNHEDLDGKVVAETNFSDSPLAADSYGHGTHIAGIIAASGDNGLGVIGVAPESQLLNVKVADDHGRCRASAVAQGIVWAVDRGALVINISIEIHESSPQLEQAVNYAWQHGAIIIAAAGNDGNQTPVYPAAYPNVIAVAATNADDTRALLSNYGEWVDVAAPGYEIYSTLPGDQYGYKSGTSFATAYVSGLAAILFDTMTDTNGNGYLNDEVAAALVSGCQPVNGFEVGYGLVDAAGIAGFCYLN